MSIGLWELVILSIVCVVWVVPIAAMIVMSVVRRRRIRAGGSRSDRSRGS